MANGLYAQYERLYFQQAELFEKNAVAGVRSALVHFSRVYLRVLRSGQSSEQVASQASPQANGTGTTANNASNNQLYTRAQEEIDAAWKTAHCQIVTSLAKEFQALASLPLPSAPHIPPDSLNDNSNNDNLEVRREIDGQSDAPLVPDDAELVDEAIHQPVREIPVYFDFIPSPSTGPRSLCDQFNYTGDHNIIEDPPAELNDNWTVNSNGKRTARHSGTQLSTRKRTQGDFTADPLDAEVEVVVDPFKVIMLHLTCPQTGCKKTKFKRKSQLKKHLLTKHQILAFQCKVKECNASFASNSHLMDHRKMAHRKRNEWPCSQCETIFQSYQELYRHFRDYHEEGRFLCPADKCTFTASTRTIVDNHQLSHQLPSCKVESPSQYQM